MFPQDTYLLKYLGTRSIQWFQATILVCLSPLADFAIAQQTLSPVKLKNSLPLPAVKERPSHSRPSSVKSLPGTNRVGKLASSLTIADEDLLLEDELPEQKANDDAGWEKVTPIPVKPSEGLNSDWLKQQGEPLPRRREIYPLDGDDVDNAENPPERVEESIVPDESANNLEPEEQADAPMYSEVDDATPPPPLTPSVNTDSAQQHPSRSTEPSITLHPGCEVGPKWKDSQTHWLTS